MKKIFSIITAFVIIFAAAPALAQYGGSSSSINNTPLLTKDRCPDGDLSGDFYDDTCDRDSDMEGGSVVDGFIFYDDNSNGSFDSFEDGVQGAIVGLLESDSRVSLGTDITNSRGYYEFTGIGEGVYVITVELPVSFLDSILALFITSANAANSYEFGVVVGEDGTVIKQDIAVERGDNTNGVSSLDGGNTAEDAATETTEPTQETMDDTTHSNRMSILDMISGNVLDAGIVTPTNDTVDIYNGFSLPAFLPQTGAMPCSE